VKDHWEHNLNVAIIGSGGHAKIVYATLLAQGNHTVRGFIDADPIKKGNSIINELGICGSTKDVHRFVSRGWIDGVIIATGNPYIREDIQDRIKDQNDSLEFISAIHPSAIIEPETKIARGVYIGPGARVGALTSIEEFAIINPGANVGHDCTLAPYTGVMSAAHISGNVTIGKYTLIGACAAIKQGVTIGDNGVIGMGTIVLHDVVQNHVVVGNPARVIGMHEYGHNPFDGVTSSK
jgi:sugar O-acyltransferase (sialic acid O-acetyltransferase NeuD family)